MLRVASDTAVESPPMMPASPTGPAPSAIMCSTTWAEAGLWEPIRPCGPLRAQPATPEAFLDVSRFAMSGVAALRPGVLARYLGVLLISRWFNVAHHPHHDCRIPRDLRFQ